LVFLSPYEKSSFPAPLAELPWPAGLTSKVLSCLLEAGEQKVGLKDKLRQNYLYSQKNAIY
jgi:hypothetical protein